MSWPVTEFMNEVNRLFQRLKLPWICSKPTEGDGSCFFHALIDQLEQPGARDYVSPRCASIHDSTSLRIAVINFIISNGQLHSLEGFQTLKQQIEDQMSWQSYLDKIRKPTTDADDFLIWCTAIFLGKDIMQLNVRSSRQPSWTVIEGTIEDSSFISEFPPLAVAYFTMSHYESIHRLPNDTRCLGCGWSGKFLRSHLLRVSEEKKCKKFYNMDELEQQAKGRHRQQRTAKQFDYDQEHKAEKQAYQSQYDQDHRAEKQAYQSQYDREHRAEKQAYNICYDKEHKVERRQSQREQKRAKTASQIAKEGPAERFRLFKEDLQDTWSIPCICCHRVLSTSGVRAIPVGKPPWRALQLELEKAAPGLFEKSIKMPIDDRMVFRGKIHLCSHCNTHLRQKHKRPPYSYKNGMECGVIPPQLKNLNDLEATLVSKRILFIKIHQLPTSRMPAVKDKTVCVPILDDDILKTMNTMTALPRRPDQAGLIPVQLKRQLKLKNKVYRAFVRPDHLVAAVKWLKEHGHPGYENIRLADLSQWDSDISEDGESSEESNDSEATEEAEEAEEPDSIRKHQFDLGEHTVLTEQYPESSVVVNTTEKVMQKKQRDDSEETFSIAPGEGKIPTNFLRDPTWDVDGFPALHPTGQFGLNHPREQKLTPQEYFKIRLQNFDRRWVNNKPYLFAALNYIERHHLERQINVSCQRGKLVNGVINNEDCCSVFDNTPGTPRYWQQRRYEVIAKLEQLGAFQMFFTLSCADRRWEENFISILKQRGLNFRYQKRAASNDTTTGYSYEADEVWVQDGEREVLLKDFMANEDEHELVKNNILNITMNFDKRVHSFIRRIINSKSSPMKAQFYHYRVEFQVRGAGHVHGVLWLDLDELQESFPNLKSIMTKLQATVRLSAEEKEEVASFVDEFITCSLDDGHLSSIVKDVQTHKHRKTCKKKGTLCRFGFPRYPSERTIIAQPLDEKDFSSERELQAEKKIHKDVLLKVKDVLMEIDQEELETVTLDEILAKAGVGKEAYYRALEVSIHGVSVILKRTPSEIYINNFNKEWLKAWDGNMDIQVCLDFFAVITYITDYYTKAEAGMTATLKEAARACTGMERKEQMRFMAEAFLKTREMGESESHYRMIPSLHLSDSNLKCTWVATGFEWNRSKFWIKMAEENKDKIIEEEEDEDDVEPQVGKTVKIPGREGKFKQTMPIHIKYANRPRALQQMCLAQFAITYDMISSKEGLKKEYISGASEEVSETHKVKSWNPEYETPLPCHIKLNNARGFMRLRQVPSILRIHKFREDKDPHEYFFSELLLYKPWRSESELYPKDMQKCIELFTEYQSKKSISDGLARKTKIEKTKEVLFPNKNSVEEARALLEEFADQRPEHIGDCLDPEHELEQEEEEAMKNLSQDEEYLGRDPENLPNLSEPPKNLPERSYYKRADISDLETMRASVRQLDRDQRLVFDIIIEYVKKLRASENSTMQKPKAPKLKIHGSGGCGKSKLFKDITTWAEYWMSVYTNKDPDNPHVLKVAPTGRAANEIDGLTVHSGLGIEFGNAHSSLRDNKRKFMRKALSNLTVVILDEMSMVKPDMLYQIHLRLQEIKESGSAFGGVSVILGGDLMQLRPVRAPWIFEPPKGIAFQLYHMAYPLWEQFKAIELTINHRQGADKTYGDLLNRVRFGQQTSEDLKVLESRLTANFPPNAVYIYGKKDPVNKQNKRELELLPGECIALDAYHMHPSYRNYKPSIRKDGHVGDTPFLDVVYLKIGARVMITYNIDTTDWLTNGMTGTVVDLVREKDKVVKILIKLDHEKAGHHLRKKFETKLARLGREECTPIGRISFEYSLGKSAKNHTARAKVIQFPLMLARAMTGHKVQGGTIKHPTPVVVDMDSCFTAGQGYVMLSRIQNLSQLFLKSFNPAKIIVSDKALEEAKKIKRTAINNPRNCRGDLWRSEISFIRKIISLNIRSLPTLIEDLKVDPTILRSDVICLQETFFKKDCPVPQLPGYKIYWVGDGRGKGVATYIRDRLVPKVRGVQRCEYEYFQGLNLDFGDLQVVNIYRSPNPTFTSKLPEVILIDKNIIITTNNIIQFPFQFVRILLSCIDVNRDTLLCGDFNLDYRANRGNMLSSQLEGRGFQQLIKVPTTIHGSCIDHAYVRMIDMCSKYKLYYPYYTDHEAICIMLKKALN